MVRQKNFFHTNQEKVIMQFGAGILISRQENKRYITFYEGHHPQTSVNIQYEKIIDGRTGLN